MDEALVVGAGPAGAACATELSRRGWQVTLVERRPRVEQKICGESLSPPSRELLSELGAWKHIPASAYRETRGVLLVGPLGSRCRLDFGDAPGERPFTVSRPALDAALVERAREAGAEIRFGQAVTRLERVGARIRADYGEVRGREFDLVIGADGRNSWVGRELGLARARRAPWPHHAAVMGHFKVEAPDPGDVQMHVTSWGYVGVNPLPEPGCANVIAVLEPGELKRRLGAFGRGNAGLLRLLEDLTSGDGATPALRERLCGARPIAPRAWSVSQMAWLPSRIAAEGCALVGDSAGFVDPFTGEGLYHALASARFVAQCAAEGQALARYSQWHREVFGPEERFCRSLQRLLGFPRLADLVVRRLGEKPALARLMAEAVADRLPTSEVMTPAYWLRVMSPLPGAPNRNERRRSA